MYTIDDLMMNVCGTKFILPYDVSVPDEGILEKTRDLFTEEHIFGFMLKGKKTDISITQNFIELPCLYEGHDDYYTYFLVLQVFRLKYNDHRRLYVKDDDAVKDGQWMVSMYDESEHGGLLEELIDIKVMPELIKSVGLKEISYKFEF